MIAKFEEIEAFAAQKLQEARRGSAGIPFAILEQYQAVEKSAGSTRMSASARGSITDLPEYKVLEHSTGRAAWAVVLAVDLRQSSWRAIHHGAENTFLTMHTYLPTMARLVKDAEGQVIGMRGDGLFAGFGVTTLTGSNSEVAPAVGSKAAQSGVRCGKAMIEAIEDIINPLLKSEGMPDGLQIGVGVDVGNVVITRIGLETANEVTAYGPPINRVCKSLTSNLLNCIRVADKVKDLFPSSKGGRVTFKPSPPGFEVVYPSDMYMLDRSSETLRKKNPR